MASFRKLSHMVPIVLLAMNLSSVFSFSAAGKAGIVATTTDNVAIVGCGVLGTSLCKQILSSPELKDLSVTGITKSTNRHESIRSESIGSSPSERLNLVTYETITKENQFQNVVFCAPPSGFEDYPGAVKEAMENLWAGPSSGGRFIFTSSGGIYGPGDGESVSETSELPPRSKSSPRTIRLLDAEEICISGKGCVLRLAGLYTLERGAHNYWLERGNGVVSGREDGIINLLHYDDAAGSCLAALETDSDKLGGKTFLVSDGHPTTRKGICESALKSKKYSSLQMPIFEGGNEGAKGKIYDGSWTNEYLQWKPVHSSFDEFMINS